MTKRKHKKRSGKNITQSSATLKRTGWREFEQENYDAAIEIWEQVSRQTPHSLPPETLAEAYFRRGAQYLYSKPRQPQAALTDLQRAAELLPRDLGYAYYLGVAAQQQGDLDTAIAAYRVARNGQSKFAARAAYPLALALLQRGDNPAEDGAWGALSDKERALLQQASAFRRRPYNPAADAPLLWRGLAALDAGDEAPARTLLEQVVAAPPNPREAGVAYYYLGVLAARGEDWEAAAQQWTAARVAGWENPRLDDNLGELYQRLAEERLEGDDETAALAAAQEAARYKPGDNKLGELISQIYQRLGYRAASAGEWHKALEYWDKASEVDGSSFRLAYNRALAHERSENFRAAGDAWREALRRRPRRADHPDAVSDEEVARLWRRAAEAYLKAGEFDESTNTYRLAVKWNPDDVNTRLALAEGLLNDGRLQAAENELSRVLERDPDNITALLRMGEVLVENKPWYFWRQRPYHWERVLELDPNNAAARQLLADHYFNQAEDMFVWGSYTPAIELYRQALEYQPNSAHITAALADCYLRLGDEAAAQMLIDQVLRDASKNLEAYNQIVHLWLGNKQPDRAWAVMAQAEAQVADIPFDFYLAQGSFCLSLRLHDEARRWFDRACAVAPPTEPVLMTIGEMAIMGGAAAVGKEYLQRALETGQELGQVHVMLGMAALMERDKKTARKHFGAADKIARQTNDADLRQRVQSARSLLNMPAGLMGILGDVVAGLVSLGPLGGLPLPDLDDEEYYDDGDFLDFFGL